MADFSVRLAFDEDISHEMIAAPAPAEYDGDTIVYHLNNARSFSLAVLSDHLHISQTVDGIEFQVYYKADSAAAAQAALDTLVGSVAIYGKLFGEFPFESLTTAEIDMYDGMEYDGIFFLGRDVYPTYNDTPENIFMLLVAHETSHNWWFSQVASDQALEPWLDEALATYCELLYLEQVHPDLVAWWWEFRVYDAKPVGPIDVTIYDYFDYERYRQAVYLRGVLFLQAVRDQVGDDAFFDFLEKYYQAGKGNIATADLFFDTLEQVSEQDIESIRSQFFKSE
jgi:aminopeptidase N